MNTESDLAARVRRHAALGEPHRLAIVDALRASDRSPSELRELTGLPSNLLAFHLDVLDDAGLVARRRSQGDARRRYVMLRWAALEDLLPPLEVPAEGPVVFVCTRNAARSQIAAALWRQRTGRPAHSAGAQPADAPDPLAIEVATAHGLDATGWRTTDYDGIQVGPAMVVSVCDRAREAGLPWTVPTLHWSVPDPTGGSRDGYVAAYRDIEARVARLQAWARAA